MTDDAGAPAPTPFADAIAAAAAAVEPTKPNLDEMPKAERMMHHRKELDSIAYWQGMEGVQDYIREYPEAREQVGVNMQARAYIKKPKGYEVYLGQIAENWLTSWIAVNETNRADVQRINDRFDIRLSPDKHFSEALTKKRIERMKTVFNKYAAPLDVTKIKSMSDVRKAAKAFWASTTADKPFGSVGVISGKTIVLMGQRFNIEKNGERDCIRPTIDGRRARIYLDDLEWVANLLVEEGPDPLLTTTGSSTGELPYSGENGENPPQTDGQISGSPYRLLSSPFGERLAALKATPQPHSTISPDEDDPLNL
jgi:hypothetical protein